MNDFVVFSKRLAKTLESMGFEIIRVVENNKRAGYYVYLFKDTQELRRAIEKALRGNHQKYSVH